MNSITMTVEEFKLDLARITERTRRIDPKAPVDKHRLSRLTLAPSNKRFYNGRTKK